jgi:glyceraldehyde 3-phosphate dehydrogenase
MSAQKIKVAINGFGRIGRAFFKLAIRRPEIEIIAINDLGDPENLAYLLQYDSIYGRFDMKVEIEKVGKLVYLVLNNEHRVQILGQKDPKKLPWTKLDIDVAVESTGAFRKYEDARQHIKAGAKKVVISAPAKSDPKEGEATVLVGVNDEKLKTCQVSSNASCTTNAGSPVISILDEALGIEKALLNTIHGYTATQALVDSPNKKDPRRGRAAAINMIPSSTGAAEATALAIPSVKDKFDGIAIRVPVPVGSLADITFVAKRNTTAEEVNNILKRASKEERWKGIFNVNEDPIVSQDIVGNSHASVADLAMTRVVDGNLVKVLAWYDNEIGYTNTLVEHVIRTGQSAPKTTKKIKAK